MEIVLFCFNYSLMCKEYFGHEMLKRNYGDTVKWLVGRGALNVAIVNHNSSVLE